MSVATVGAGVPTYLLAVATGGAAGVVSLYWLRQLLRVGRVARWGVRFISSWLGLFSFCSVFILLGEASVLDRYGATTTRADAAGIALFGAVVWATVWPIIGVWRRARASFPD